MVATSVGGPSGGLAAVLAGLFTLGGLWCAAMLIGRMTMAGRATASETNPVWRVGAKPWTIEDVAVATVGVLTVTLGVSAVAGGVTGVFFDGQSGALFVVAMQLIVYVAIGTGFAVMMRRRAITMETACGIRVAGSGRALLMGVAFWFAFLPLVGLTMAGVEWVYRWLHLELHRQDVVEILMAEKSVLARASIMLFAVVAAPVAEEFFFRGFVYPAVKQKWGTGWALALSSVAFAAMHHHVPTFAALAVLGVGLALAYEWTGSLLAPVAMHATFNAGTMLLILLGVEPS
jgi:membrane protease YdiL (CAAX protease family)